MSRWIGLKIGNRFNRSVEMRMVLPFWHYFSRRSNFLDNRDTSAKQLRANWSVGRTKEIFCKSLKNKWKGHPGAPPTTRIAGIVSFGIKFSVSKPPSCWIFVFFWKWTLGRPPIAPMVYIRCCVEQIDYIIESWRNMAVCDGFSYI